VIRPALAAGMVVVCDRYADSTLAYQGFGSGTDLASLEAVTQFATGGLSPHLTVLIDLDVRIGLERKRQASRAGEDDMNRIDLREVSYHERVREGFLTLARRTPERFFVVDGTRAPELIADEIWDRVIRLVPVKAETRRLL
jgi:dTMP kinase